jgi:hypothetical protein
MKYIYQEPLISTVSDDEITNDAQIKELLTKLKVMQHSVYMEYLDSDHPDTPKKLESVRITEIKENTIDIHAFFPRASAKIKNIPFQSILKIRLIASKQLISTKYKVSRWHLMDVAEINAEIPA